MSCKNKVEVKNWSEKRRVQYMIISIANFKWKNEVLRERKRGKTIFWSFIKKLHAKNV